MEYQKTINLLDNQIRLLRHLNLDKKNWVEINDDRIEHYSQKDLIFDTAMLKSSLCDYSDVYVLVKGTITVVGQLANDAGWRSWYCGANV